LENGSPVNTKTNQLLGYFLLSQTPLLHEGLNYYNSKIIYILYLWSYNIYHRVWKFEYVL
jgi:hypothetical protein